MRVEDDSVADDGLAVGPQDAAGDELEDEFLAADDDGVSGVVAASVAGDDGKALGEHVDDLAFAFIAPLGAENDCCFCSHGSLLPGIKLHSSHTPTPAFLTVVLQ